MLSALLCTDSDSGNGVRVQTDIVWGAVQSSTAAQIDAKSRLCYFFNTLKVIMLSVGNVAQFHSIITIKKQCTIKTKVEIKF